MKFGVLMIAVALGIAPGRVVVQSRPDFSGDWVLADSTPEQRSVAAVGDAGFRTGNMGSGWGSPLTLRQQSNQLVVEYAFFSTYDLQPRLRFTYSLDGSESRNGIMVGHAESVLRSRVAWRDTTLVITTVYPGPVGTTEVRHVLSLASPTSLIIETTRAGAGGAPVVSRAAYAQR